MKCKLKDEHKIFEHIVKRSSSEQEIFLITSKKNSMHFSSIWSMFSVCEQYFHQICPMHDILDVKFNLRYTNRNFKMSLE